MNEINGSDLHQEDSSFTRFCKRSEIQDLTARYHEFFQTEDGAKLSRMLSLMAAGDRGGTLSTLEYRTSIKMLSAAYGFPIDDVVLMFRFYCELLCDSSRRMSQSSN